MRRRAASRPGPVRGRPRGRRAAAAAPPGEALRAQLEGMTVEDVRRRYLAPRSRPPEPEAPAILAELATRRLRVDVTAGAALADAALAVGRKAGRPEGVAHGLRARGNALLNVNDYRGAVEHQEEAARLFAEAGRPTEVGRTLSTSIQPLILLGQYGKAQAAAARARKIFEQEGDTLRLARLGLNEGNIFHRQDRFAEALRAYEEAHARLLPLGNEEGIAVALGNIAMCLISLNDFARALETHQRNRAFCQQHGLPRLVALADYNIAYLHYFRGQYGRAIEALKATREACLAAGDAYLAALCRMDLAEIYLELNLSEEAAQAAEEALLSFRELRNGYEEAKSLAWLAIAHGQQGKVLRALELCAEARGSFVREGNAVWPALLDLYQALILFGAGRLFESRRHCVAALEAFASSPLLSKTVLCRLLLARLALRLGDLEGARRECGAAEEALARLDVPALGFQAHYVKGQIEQAAGSPPAAYQAFLRAREFLETLRGSLQGEELKIAFMKNKLEVYEGLVDLALGEHGAGPAEAFSCVEQAKSRSLQELLARAASPVVPNVAGKSGLVRRVSDLREELNWYYHRIEAEQMAPEERTAERIEGLQREARAHEDELLRVLRELPAEESGAMEAMAPVSLPLADIQRALPAGSMLVEYFRIGSRLLAFLVSPAGLEVVPVALVPRVQHVLRLLQFQLSWARPDADAASPWARPSSLAATQAHLAELYQELVAPLRPRLQASHLVFVPHDLLHYVPFHALYDGERHLIDSFSVSYAPSATIYAQCQARRSAPGPSLVLGVPQAGTPLILDEARAVAARLPGAVLRVGDEATSQVVREAAGDCRFVHLASHGFFRPDNPMFSGIRLGAGSYLTLYDLYNLRLRAELVSLSACVTGVNVIAAGDELLGLARGLFRAGAAALLLTLWDVPDRSAAPFMEAFYDRLDDPNRAAALRSAILAIRETYPHPIHWAPYVLMGKVFQGEGRPA